MDEQNRQQEMPLESGQQFMKLYLAIQRRLYGFVLSLVPLASDADDIVQNTVTVMWTRFHEFQPGTDFAAWAFTIARFQIMAWRQKNKAAVQFGPEAMDRIGEIASIETLKEDYRLGALRQCLNKLNPGERQILHLRYEVGNTLRDVAERVGQNINTLYSSLNRIHIALLHCVRRNLAGDK